MPAQPPDFPPDVNDSHMADEPVGSNDPQGATVEPEAKPIAAQWSQLWKTEDWWAIWIGAILLLANLFLVYSSVTHSNPLKPWLAAPAKWTDNPLDSLAPLKEGKRIVQTIVGMGVVFVISALLFGLGNRVIGRPFSRFVIGFVPVFFLAILAYMMAGHTLIHAYNLEYALWALLVGLSISNTIGTPEWIRPALCAEFVIKTGLVLLGAEVLLTVLLALGIPGIFIAWFVTPVVLITTYWFGQRVLGMESRTLNMVISADMSVCGVSAAIATAAACRAKKEELSLAIGLSLCFTVIMMVILPAVIKMLGMSELVGGAWIGGTIDSTGAVSAAGGMLGDVALKAATTIKMIQNVLIGVVAFGVALYWVLVVEPSETARYPSLWELWYRFPKFVLGFIGASIAFTILYHSDAGPEMVTGVIGGTKIFRGWFFCLAFVMIGLETDFRSLAKFFGAGKPLILYVCGQSLNLSLTLFMAWLMFDVIFTQSAALVTGTP